MGVQCVNATQLRCSMNRPLLAILALVQGSQISNLVKLYPLDPYHGPRASSWVTELGATGARIFLYPVSSIHISTLPNIKYVVMLHPF